MAEKPLADWEKKYMLPRAECPKVKRSFGCSVCGASGDLVERRDWLKGTLAVCVSCDENYSHHWY